MKFFTFGVDSVWDASSVGNGLLSFSSILVLTSRHRFSSSAFSSSSPESLGLICDFLFPMCIGFFCKTVQMSFDLLHFKMDSLFLDIQGGFQTSSLLYFFSAMVLFILQAVTDIYSSSDILFFFIYRVVNRVHKKMNLRFLTRCWYGG